VGIALAEIAGWLRASDWDCRIALDEHLDGTGLSVNRALESS